jgi:hypothetical protein
VLHDSGSVPVKLLMSVLRAATSRLLYAASHVIASLTVVCRCPYAALQISASALTPAQSQTQLAWLQVARYVDFSSGFRAVLLAMSTLSSVFGGGSGADRLGNAGVMRSGADKHLCITFEGHAARHQLRGGELERR